MPNKTIYLTDEFYALLLQVSQKEYPAEEKLTEAVSRLVNRAVKEQVIQKAKKLKIPIPKSVKEEMEKLEKELPARSQPESS